MNAVEFGKLFLSNEEIYAEPSFKNLDFSSQPESQLFGRITNGSCDDDFTRLSCDVTKRLSWMFGLDTLLQSLRKSHLDILLDAGYTLEWIQHKLSLGIKFKLIVVHLSIDQVHLATWDNVFELMSRVYPEIDVRLWSQHENLLKNMSFKEIDPHGVIISNYYLGSSSEQYITLERFRKFQHKATLFDVRSFLYHHVGLNELFQGSGKTMTSEGAVGHLEYLTINKALSNFEDCMILDLNPII